MSKIRVFYITGEHFDFEVKTGDIPQIQSELNDNPNFEKMDILE